MTDTSELVDANIMWRQWVAFTVDGLPAPKGSMTAVRGGHHMIEANPRIRAWRAVVRDNASVALRLYHKGDPPLVGPVAVRLGFTLHRPPSQTRRTRPWPTHQSPGHGDIDKLARGVLDALEDAAVFLNDAQVVVLNVVKQYGDSGRADALRAPGVVVGVFRWDPGR